MQQITLYYREGSSDKVYQCAVVPCQRGPRPGTGYHVTFAYGRRGTALNVGRKTTEPVTLEEATRIYDKLVREKTAKGYTPGESGTPYQHPGDSRQTSGIRPQLLNAIDHDEAARLISNPRWVMQEKFDGKRLLIRKSTSGIEGINRNGLIVALPQSIEQAVASLDGHFILDGESLGELFVAFDLLERNGTDYRPLPCQVRLQVLSTLIAQDGPHLMVAETAVGTAHKTAMLERLKAEDKEGAVFKHHAAPYTPGRPANGGDALKLKFYETASFLVGRINRQRSVSLTLLNGGQLVPAGNVTIPPNHEVPVPGDVVEVRYLYAFPESGCVYQPVYLGLRHDIMDESCTTLQLKFKAEAQAQAA